MIFKTNLLSKLEVVSQSGQLRAKLAKKYHGEISRSGEGEVDLVAEMAKHPNFLWIRSKAIEADVPNDNGDYFSREEIMKSYKTFEGVPIFTNHENQKVENAKGKVVKAEWVDAENSVYCTAFIDREAFPALCRSIEEGIVTDVSMGTQVDYSTCSVCENKAYTADSYCFVGGTPITMSDLSVKNIEDVVEGDEVLDAFGKPTKVVKTFSHEANEPVQLITSRAIMGSLSCTGNHPMLVSRRGEYRFVEASDIDDNETLFSPRPCLEESLSIFDEIDFDRTDENLATMARLIGYFTAEGCVSEQGGRPYTTEFTIHSAETEMLADIKAAAALIGKEASVFSREAHSSKAISVRIYDSSLATFLSRNVSGLARDKKLSRGVIRLPKSLLREFVVAYVEGDGHCTKISTIVVHTASRNLVYQVYYILAKIGCISSLNSFMQAGGPTTRDSVHEIFRLSFGSTQAKKLNATKGKIFRAASKDVAHSKLTNTLTPDGQFVKHSAYAVEEVPYAGTVYNFETESHSYVANNVATHNCDHVRTMKGRNLNGKKIFEKNYGLKFIELSVVTDGACEACIIEQIIDPSDYVGNANAMMAAAAVVEGIVKTGGFSKDAGQQEIQELNEAMSLIEKVTRAMLDQRQYVDLEFASKVMEVLADLQHVTDELVDQGYASIGNPGQQQGQEMQVPPMTENAEMGKEQPGQGQKPSITGPATSGVGKVTEPATAASDRATLSTRIALVKDISEKLAKFYEEKQQLSGGDVSKEAKFQETITKLAKIWENPSVRNYSAEVSDGDFKIVIGGQDIWGMRGGQRIAQLKLADLDADVKDAIAVDQMKVAVVLLEELKRKFANIVVAQKAPSNAAEQQAETMEAQLESQKLPLHAREHDVRQNITEDQLNKKRDGYDLHARRGENRQEITEIQLHKGDYPGYDNFKPQDAPRTETMEPQLRDNGIKGNNTPADVDSYAAGVTDQKQEITEAQIEAWRKADKGHNPTAITENQLKDDIGEPWGRRIASKDDAKKALAAGMKAIVHTASATGATPDEIIAAVSHIAGNPKTLVACIEKIDAMAKDQGARESRGNLLSRASFHGKLVVASKQDVTEYLLGSLTDVGMSGEVGMYALETLASQKDAFNKIAKAIEAGFEEAPKQVVASAKDLMKQALLDEEVETESIKVLIPKADISANETDKEAFAKAAFAAATKVANAQGLKVTSMVHVASKEDGMVEVAMVGTKEEKKEEKVAASEVEARKEARKRLVEAQSPGGAGAPPAGGAGGGMGGMGGGGTTMPQMPPGDPSAQPPVGALGETPAAEEPMEDEGGGEALPPGSICPACGSDDVDVRKGEFNCNNCGATGHITVRMDLDNWPGTIEEKTPDKGDDAGMPGEGGEEIGGMGEGEGMEMPPVGVAASFRVTPEMVKVAQSKPIGSYCPRCGSGKVELATKMGNGDGKCCSCASKYKVESYVDQANDNEMWARVEWVDGKPAKKASKAVNALGTKKAALENALKAKGLTGKFANADFNGKAQIIAKLHDEKLLG